jgi:hypothetical protein
VRVISVAAASVARAGRLGLIAIAAVLVAGSIVTSLARPAPRAFTPGDTSLSPEGEAVTLGESTVPIPATAEPIETADAATESEAWMWRAAANSWAKSSDIPANEVSGGQVVPSVVRAHGLTPGGSYLIRLQYGACEAVSGRAFARLASAQGAQGSPLLSEPGPGRQRPDSTIPIPAEHASASGGAAPNFALWGATFNGPAVSGTAPDGCSGGSTVEMWVRAHAETLVLVFGGELGEPSQDDSGGLIPVVAYVSTFP